MTNGKPAVETMVNGMRLVTVPMPGVKSLTVLAMVGVGSRFEEPKMAGISHFLEHLPFKGTANYPDSLAISSVIDGVGGKHNAFTSKDYTGYWVKVASTKAELALDVVSDLLLTARLRDEDIEREKGVIVEEINMYEDEPQAKVANLFDELVFDGSGLAGDVIGTKKTVTALNASNFRSHFDRWYTPDNIVIGLVGDLDKLNTQNSKLKTTVEEAFSKGNHRAGGGKKMYGVPPQTEPRMNIFYKDTEQAHFYLGFPGLARGDEQRYALSVMVTILGGNSSSRLFNEIREKRGLAYYAYASSDLYHDVGSVYALEGVALEKIDESIKVTLEEFERMANGETITDKEVKRAKEYVVGKMALDLEDSSTMANVVVRRLLLEDKVESLDEILTKVKAVTVEEVRAVARRVVDFGKLNLAVVGPYKDQAAFDSLINYK